MILFQNVTKIYQINSKEIYSLKNISFEIEKGEFVLIVGKSGAGKTTLLKLLIAEEKPTQGKIFFEKEEINKMNSKQICLLRRKIGVVFQDYKLLPSKTVFENVSYVLEILGTPWKKIKDDVTQVLDIVGLLDKKDAFPLMLSGGEAQRVAIARALIHRPKIIWADEPTGNLDPYNTLEIIRVLEKIHQMGTTLALTTHNKEVVNKLKKRVITIGEGEIKRDEEEGRFTL